MKRDSGLGTRDSGLLDATLAHLRALVAFDTRNPPRAIGKDGMFDYVRGALPGFAIALTDHGAGSISLLAVRGRPRLLFNVHLDTVPGSPHWSADPFGLHVGDGRATGLGACDIKGAAAALLAVANASTGDMALLFTTDEEGAKPRCIRAFLDRAATRVPSPDSHQRRVARSAPRQVPLAPAGRGPRVRGDDLSRVPSPESRVPIFSAVIVAEPTRCEAVLAHRGIQSVRLRFRGRAGHASGEQAPTDSALHQAVRWGGAALDYADAQAVQEFGRLRGLRFNLGRIEGGIKANVIAPEAEVRFGMRPLPSMDPDVLLERVRTLADPAPAACEETFRGPSLPADAANAQACERDARALADELGIGVGGPVDFWTEASLFSAAGHTAFVYGPGDIAQAHGADEWVALAQLENYAATVLRIVDGGRA